MLLAYRHFLPLGKPRGTHEEIGRTWFGSTVFIVRGCMAGQAIFSTTQEYACT